MLSDLLDGLSSHGFCPQDLVVRGLSRDSRTVRSGDCYLAVQGHQAHGLEFLSQAIARGASAALWETSPQVSIHDYDHPPSLATIGVDKLNDNLGLIASRFYAAPSRSMRVAAVTGTDGKTSVSHFIAQMAAARWANSGLIGTLGYGPLGQLQTGVNTTPDALSVHRVLSDLYRCGIRHVAIEASSHGLRQKRLSETHVDVAALTNLGHDHSDYHGSQAAYADAKMELFNAGPRVAVLNRDDPFSQRVAERLADRKCRLVFYSLQDPSADVYADSIRCSDQGSEFSLRLFGQMFTAQSKTLGRFNVANLLAAAATLHVWGVPARDIAELLKRAHPVPGRMNLLSAPGRPQVIIDYAHTPDALTAVLKGCREFCRGRLHCVFGCGGNRDRTKRGLMGKAAAELADCLVLCDDNPRDEDPAAILDDIQSGLPEGCDHQRIHDRQRAIAHALDRAKSDDCVVIAGKGHEKEQLVGASRYPFDDTAVAASLLGVAPS